MILQGHSKGNEERQTDLNAIRCWRHLAKMHHDSKHLIEQQIMSSVSDVHGKSGRYQPLDHFNEDNQLSSQLTQMTLFKTNWHMELV